MLNKFEIGNLVTSTLKNSADVTILGKYFDSICQCWYYQVNYNNEKRYVQESVLKLVL
jgi:hypothetical protein